jgi:hypothetical protein
MEEINSRKGMTMPLDHGYWFPSKRYGWGWGLPVRWQGWVTLIVFIGLVWTVAAFFHPAVHPVAFGCLIVVLIAGFTLVCWMKGEPTRWRWGKD